MNRKNAPLPDLKRAFGALPEGYVRRTRYTLDSLEEGTQVKKTFYGAALAVTCALLMMSVGLAAGITGMFNGGNDPASTAALSKGGGESGVMVLDENLDAEIVSAQFDGRYMYVRVAWNNAKDYYDQNYQLSLRVNGREPGIVSGWLTAMEGGMEQYEYILECDRADAAMLSIRLGNDGRGAVLTRQLDARPMKYYKVTQHEGAAALTEGYAIAGEDFGFVRVKYAMDGDGQRRQDIERLSRSNIAVQGARVASRMTDDEYSLDYMFGADMPTDIAISDEQTGVDMEYELLPVSELPQLAYMAGEQIAVEPEDADASAGEQEAVTTMSEAIFDGELLYLRVEATGVDAAFDLSDIRVNDGYPETLCTSHEMHNEGDSTLGVYSALFRCEPADEARVYASFEGAASFDMLATKSDKMERYNALTADGYASGWAVNGPGFGMATVRYDADSAAETEIMEDIQGKSCSCKIPGTSVNRRYDGESLELQVFSTLQRLPDEILLYDGNAAAMSISLEPAEGALEEYDEDVLAQDYTMYINDAIAGDGYIMLQYGVRSESRRVFDGTAIEVEHEPGSVNAPENAQEGALVLDAPKVVTEYGSTLEPLYHAAWRPDENNDRELSGIALFKSEAEGGTLRLKHIGGRVALAHEFDAAPQPGRMRALDAEAYVDKSDMRILDVKALDIDGMLFMAVEYAPESGSIGQDTPTLYGSGYYACTDIIEDASGIPEARRLSAVYDMPEDGQMRLYLSDDEEAAVTIAVKGLPGIEVLEATHIDGYMYSIVKVTPGNGGSAIWSRSLDALGSLLEDAVDAGRRGEMSQQELADRLAAIQRAGDELEAMYAGKNDDGADVPSDEHPEMIDGADGSTDIQIGDEQPEMIGGADGATDIQIGDDKPNVIGGADGSTNIQIGDEQPAIIGGADGPTSIFTTNNEQEAASIGIIGGADGPTSIIVSDFGNAFLNNPRILRDGWDVTLCVADVTQYVKETDCAPGERVFMLVCDYEEGSNSFACEMNGIKHEVLIEDVQDGSIPDEMNDVGELGLGELEGAPGVKRLYVQNTGLNVAFIDAHMDIEPGFEQGARDIFLYGGVLGDELIEAVPNAIGMERLPAGEMFGDGSALYHMNSGCGGKELAPMSAEEAARMLPCTECVGAVPVILGADEDANEISARLVADEGGKGCRVCQIVPAGEKLSVKWAKARG